MKTGPALKKLRLKKGYSAAQIARDIQCSNEYMCRVELGRFLPSQSFVIKYLKSIDKPQNNTILKAIKDDLFKKWTSGKC
jgi:transcriptional regulator with XRE-family HTH domain